MSGHDPSEESGGYNRWAPPAIVDEAALMSGGVLDGGWMPDTKRGGSMHDTDTSASRAASAASTTTAAEARGLSARAAAGADAARAKANRLPASNVNGRASWLAVARLRAATARLQSSIASAFSKDSG